MIAGNDRIQLLSTVLCDSDYAVSIHPAHKVIQNTVKMRIQKM